MKFKHLININTQVSFLHNINISKHNTKLQMPKCVPNLIKNKNIYEIYNLKNLFCNLISTVVDTLFQFKNIHQSLIVYLFIHGFFYEYHVSIKQHTPKIIIFYFEKTVCFGHELL